MKKSYIFLRSVFTGLLVIALLALCAGCPSESDEPDGPDEQPETWQTLSGTVRSLSDNSPVSGASVSAGGHSTTTNESGSFSLNVPETVDGKIISITKPEYGLYSKTMSVTHDQEVVISPYLVPADFTMVVDPTEAIKHTFETADGATVVFPDLSGSDITEKLKVTIVHYDVSTEELVSAPGVFRGLSADGSEATLVSQGMIEVRVAGETTGNTYSFDGAGYQFEITLPVSGDPTKAEATIPLWYYDESTGLWMEEGTATLVTDSDTGKSYYQGTVSHFTVWNMDLKLPITVTAHGTISDPEDDIYDLSIRGEGIYFRNLTTKEKDIDIIRLPPEADMELRLVKRSTGNVYITTFTTPASGTIELGDLMGTGYPFVNNLQYTREGADSATFTWNDPVHTEFQNIQFRVTAEDGTELETTNIPGGTETFTASALPEGLITFEVTVVYSGGNSGTVTRSVRIGTESLVTFQYGSDILSYDIDEYLTVWYSFGASTGYIEYTTPFFVPVGTEVRFYVTDTDFPPDIFKPERYYWYRKYGTDESYLDDSEISFESDADDSLLTLYFSGCGPL